MDTFATVHKKGEHKAYYAGQVIATGTTKEELATDLFHKTGVRMSEYRVTCSVNMERGGISNSWQRRGKQ